MSSDAPFKLSLLGTPRVFSVDGRQIHIENPFMVQLLALLLLNPHKTFLRTDLCSLFYPDHDEKQAEQNLRQTIHRLRKLLDDSDDENSLLVREPMALRLNPNRATWVDVTEFIERVQKVRRHQHRRMTVCHRCIQNLEAAASLYHDAFMIGIVFNGSMEEWAFAQRSLLLREMSFVLATLTRYFIEQGAWLKAQTYLDRWLMLDALDEDAVMLQMRLFAAQGKRLFALQFYAEFRNLLERRLATTPSPETEQLATALQAGRSPDTLPGSPYTMPLPNAETVRPSVIIPPEIGAIDIPYVGRHEEIGVILDRLSDISTRLITVTGAGGIGKTALALQVARLDVQNWQDGVTIVSLKHCADLMAKLADMLRLPIQPGQNTSSEVYHYLRDKEMLLVLDEVDCLPDLRYALKSLLFHAPQIRIITTSRRRLSIGMELNIHLGGLPYPDAALPDPQLADCPAVRLFLESARTFYPSITFDGADLVVIGQICATVQGFPLAIVLAASWSQTLPYPHILANIQHDGDFPKDRLAVLLPDHGSMRVVFNQSWMQLDPHERKSLSRLARIEGSFTLIQAQKDEAVAAEIVIALVDKSLLKTPSPTYFEIYPVFKPFIVEAGTQLS
jgi:DNA-binding SARP family transcriptional activator